MSRRKQQPTRIGSTALATIPLYFEGADGSLSPMGPLQSIGLLLEEQHEVSEAAIQTIAQSYDDPNVVATALSKLGAIRVRKDSGETVFTLGGDGIPRSSDGTEIGGGTGRVQVQEGSASMSIGFASGSALDAYDRTGSTGAMVPLRQATQSGMQLGQVNVIRKPDGTRWVAKADLDAFLATSGRTSPTGAQKVITDKLTEAQTQRSTAVRDAARARKTSREYKDRMRAQAKPAPGSTAH